MNAPHLRRPVTSVCLVPAVVFERCFLPMSLRVLLYGCPMRTKKNRDDRLFTRKCIYPLGCALSWLFVGM